MIFSNLCGPQGGGDQTPTQVSREVCPLLSPTQFNVCRMLIHADNQHQQLLNHWYIGFPHWDKWLLWYYILYILQCNNVHISKLIQLLFWYHHCPTWCKFWISPRREARGKADYVNRQR